MFHPVAVGTGKYPTITGGPFPAGVSASVTSLYGPREPLQTPNGYTGAFHYGIDLYADPPPLLVALMEGVVEVAVAGDAAVGNWMRVRAGEWSYDYYHMADAPVFAAGDEVAAGQYVGQVGSTGLSTAPHLHLGMTLNGESIDPLEALKSFATEAGSPAQEDEMKLIPLTTTEKSALGVALGGDGGVFRKHFGNLVNSDPTDGYEVYLADDGTVRRRGGLPTAEGDGDVMTNQTFWVGVLIAGAVGVAQVLVSFDPTKVADWQTWAVGLTGAFIRPAAAYIVAKVATGRS
jgi:hypothetical protein